MENIKFKIEIKRQESEDKYDCFTDVSLRISGRGIEIELSPESWYDCSPPENESGSIKGRESNGGGLISWSCDSITIYMAKSGAGNGGELRTIIKLSSNEMAKFKNILKIWRYVVENKE